MEGNPFERSVMCRESEAFRETFIQLGAILKQIPLFGHRFQAAFGLWGGGVPSADGGSVTVNKAGRLLSFSISLGIPMLSQRTRKFSLHTLKQESQSEITLSERETGKVNSSSNTVCFFFPVKSAPQKYLWVPEIPDYC